MKNQIKEDLPEIKEGLIEVFLAIPKGIIKLIKFIPEIPRIIFNEFKFTYGSLPTLKDCKEVFKMEKE